MKMINKNILGFLVLACLAFSGCAGTPIQMGNSSKKFDRSKIDFENGREISANAGGFQLLLFIPIAINSRHERAMQNLKAQAGGDYITDIKIQEYWRYGFVGTVYGVKMKAMAYPYKK
ncbi:MAG: hypothetical protein ACI9TO_000940 [Rickettsiales bacterium]|jgi:hypothetical protein